MLHFSEACRSQRSEVGKVETRRSRTVVRPMLGAIGIGILTVGVVDVGARCTWDESASGPVGWRFDLSGKLRLNLEKGGG